MWSLPDIQFLSARAKAALPALRRAQRSHRKPACEGFHCGRPAVESVPWFDIFSDDPKGLIHVCDEHCAEDTGEYFRCEECDRVIADHYTWEWYQTTVGDRTLCLKCAAEEYFADEKNWLDPQQVTEIVCAPYNLRLNGHNIPLFDCQTGVFNFARCPHVLGVKQPLPARIQFHDNAEFDSCDGRQISGDDLLQVVRELNKPFCPVLDAAYQFTVSIGIYIRRCSAGHN